MKLNTHTQKTADGAVRSYAPLTNVGEFHFFFAFSFLSKECDFFVFPYFVLV